VKDRFRSEFVFVVIFKKDYRPRLLKEEKGVPILPSPPAHFTCRLWATTAPCVCVCENSSMKWGIFRAPPQVEPGQTRNTLKKKEESVHTTHWHNKRKRSIINLLEKKKKRKTIFFLPWHKFSVYMCGSLHVLCVSVGCKMFFPIFFNPEKVDGFAHHKSHRRIISKWSVTRLTIWDDRAISQVVHVCIYISVV
jgi:hypothetical protein